MKKITLTFFAFLLTASLWQVNAQITENQNFGTDGYDQDGDVLTVNAADITVNSGHPINGIVLANFTSHYGSPTGTTTWCVNGWYEFTLAVDGTPVVTGCAGDINGVDVTGFTTLTITIADLDGYYDHVYWDVDLAVTYTPPFIGVPPVISCPADVVADSNPGACGAVVNFADASATDPDGTIVAITQTPGTPLSGEEFPIGVTVVEFSAEDNDGNVVYCDFTVTVTDIENPMAMCQDLTVELDGTGMVSITPADIDNGSSDNCGGFTLALDTTSFSCGDVGENTVTLTITDADGLTDTCTATVTVEDNQAPVVICMGSGGTITEVETFEGATIPSGWTTVIEVGTHDWTFGSGDLPYVPVDDFPTNAAIFDDDAAGIGEANFARLVSPVYNLTGVLTAEVSFDYYFRQYGFGSTETFSVEVWDGAAWQEILFDDSEETPITNTGAIDVLAYANADFQIRFSYDDNDTWGYAAGVDNVNVQYELAPVPPLEVVLDATGHVSVDLNDMLFSVDDNCGYTVAVGSGTTVPCEQSSPSNNWENGFNCVGGYRAANDVTVDADTDFNLEQLTANLIHLSGETVASVDLYFYDDNAGEPGTEVGNAIGVVPTSSTVLATGLFGAYDGSEVVFDVPYTFPSQSGVPTTYWVVMEGYSSAGGPIFWETSTVSTNGEPALVYDYTISAWTVGDPVSEGVYTFSGTCGTAAKRATFDFDCSNLGENMVDLAVTDAGGNIATCTATVIVSDETAPVLVCGPEPLLYGANTVSDSPGLTIDTSGSDVIISSIISVTDDYTITDMNVPVNITHSYSGDLYITLTSPAGTTVVLKQSSFDSTPDVIVTYDDEGTAAAEALTAFDGESTMGDWTLYIEDTWPGLDSGMLNSWGLEYEYSYPNPATDLFIELGADGTVTIEPMDVLSTMEEACEIDVMLIDITDFTCDDIGTPTLVTIFANDTSGNFASCQIEVNIVDMMEPALTCPGNTTAPFDPATGLYVLPDYFDLGDAFATDNCTDASMLVLTQDPAPGTSLPVSTTTITFTAEDEYGNIATCSMELEVDVQGIEENELLANALGMYPNPATNQVTLVNSSAIALEAAMIYDLNGKLVAEIDLSNMQNETTFDVSNFASGVFMVKIIGENASTVKRLIKE